MLSRLINVKERAHLRLASTVGVARPPPSAIQKAPAYTFALHLISVVETRVGRRRAIPVSLRVVATEIPPPAELPLVAMAVVKLVRIPKPVHKTVVTLVEMAFALVPKTPRSVQEIVEVPDEETRLAQTH